MNPYLADNTNQRSANRSAYRRLFVNRELVYASCAIVGPASGYRFQIFCPPHDTITKKSLTSLKRVPRDWNRLLNRPVEPLKRNECTCHRIESLVVLKEQFSKLRQSNERQWDNGSIGFISRLFCEPAGADV